jgi:hypothetical protein
MDMQKSVQEWQEDFLKGKEVTFGVHQYVTLPKDPKIEKLKVKLSEGRVKIVGESDMIPGTTEVPQGSTLFVHQNAKAQLLIQSVQTS